MSATPFFAAARATATVASPADSSPFSSLSSNGDGASDAGDVSSSQWTGRPLDGTCWRIHAMEALPLPGVGLANTLFGFVAACTFLIILYIVWMNNRRARSTSASSGTMEESAASRRSASVGAAAGFAQLSPWGGGNDSIGAMSMSGSTASRGGNGSVPFSSYVQFLYVSSVWALLWALYNIFPQLSDGRSSPTLIWHSIVASLVYTTSLFLELGVVVFLLSGTVGHRAFRLAALTSGCVALLYGSLNLALRIAFDIHPAEHDENYPVDQLDFISSKPTLAFLTFTSVVLTLFFFTTCIRAYRGSQQPSAEERAKRRKKRSSNKKQRVTAVESSEMSSQANGSARPSASSSLSNLHGSNDGKAWSQDAKTPLITPKPVHDTASTPLMHAAAMPSAQGYQSEGELQRTRPASASASASTVDHSAVTEPTLVHVSVRTADAPSRTPSPSSALSKPPKRRSLIGYSLFLALYYALKTAGLILLYVHNALGICLLDGIILIYMASYAFLLYWTLLQDSKYWHQLLNSVEVTMEDENESESLLTGKSEDGDASGSLLTQASPTGSSSRNVLRKTSAEASSKASMQLRQALGSPTGPSSSRPLRSASHAEETVGAAVLPWLSSSASPSSSSSSSSSMSSASGKRGFGTIHLRDFLISPNQLEQLRAVRVPENGKNKKSRAAGRGAAASADAIHSTSSRGRSQMSHSDSGTNLAMGMSSASKKWSLAHVSSRVTTGLRVVTGGWSDRNCEIYLSRWKGNHLAVVKQYTLPSITADFFVKHFSTFIAQVPMGLWLGCPACQHENLALVLGVCVDPPCVSIVFEYGSVGTLYDILYPRQRNQHGGGHNQLAAAVSPSTGSQEPPPHSPTYQSLSPAVGAASLPSLHLDGNRLQRSPSIGSTFHATPTALNSSILSSLKPMKAALQIAQAMNHLQRWSQYDSHPLHLSPANIMLDDQLNVRIADFSEWFDNGVEPHAQSRHGHGRAHGPMHMHSRHGGRRRGGNLPQPAWQSPEVLAGSAPTRSSAVYSFGVILWCLLTWQYPYVLVPAESNESQHSRMYHGHGRAPSPSRSTSSFGYSSHIHSSGVASVPTRPSILKSPRLPDDEHDHDEPHHHDPTTARIDVDRDEQRARAEQSGVSRSDSPSPVHSTINMSAVGVDGYGDGDGDVDTLEGSGAPPIVYERIPIDDVKTARTHILVANRRPPLPSSIPAPLLRLIELCWDESPDDRPSFSIIEDFLHECEGCLDEVTLPLADTTHHGQLSNDQLQMQMQMHAAYAHPTFPYRADGAGGMHMADESRSMAWA